MSASRESHPGNQSAFLPKDWFSVEKAGEQPLIQVFPFSSSYQHVQLSEIKSGDNQEGHSFNRQALALPRAKDDLQVSKSSLKRQEVSQPGVSL